MVPKFFGEVIFGNLRLYQPERYEEYILSLDGDVELTLEKVKKQRSNNQNRYYWGVVVELLSKELGYTTEETHEALKYKFLMVEKGVLPTVKSTTDLTTQEFEEFMSRVREWSSVFLNCYIPDPNEVKL